MKKVNAILQNRQNKGFTIVELLMALLVTSIILAAVTSLAYAMGQVTDRSDDTSEKQAVIRSATLRLTYLLKHCRLVCSNSGDRLVVWRADDDNDGEIDPDELVYIIRGSGRNYIRLLDFPAHPDEIVLDIGLVNIQSESIKATLLSFSTPREVVLVSNCSDVQFLVDLPPPWTKSVSISFDITENKVAHRYEINTTLLSWAGHILNSSGTDIVIDDDE